MNNIYAAEGDIELKATKVFTGRDWTENDSFEFTLAASENNPEGAVLPANVKATATRDAQTVAFDKIKFTKTGTFNFTITETDGGLDGVTYDTTPKTITVKVTDNGDGTLKATPTPETATVTASNTYAAEGDIELKATKVFTGRDWTENDSFEFTLAADPANPEGAVLPANVKATATKDAQTVAFDKIKFTKTGTFNFTITETDGGLDGVAYDTTPKTIMVEVTDNGDGTLKATPTPGTATVTASNVYNAEGEISLGAEKVLTGRDWTENDSFEFTLAADPANPEGATMPATLVKSATKDEKTVTFDKIKFTKAGTFNFTITETDGGLDGVTYDTTPKTIKVEVTDNGDGTLKAKATPESAKVTAENTYAAEGDIELKATKVFTGRDWTENDSFEFTLAASENNPEGAVLPENVKVTATKDAQTVAFDKIKFTKAGTFSFTITETDGGLDGVTYDTTPKTITVEVTDNGDGTLKATPTPETATVTASNTYAAEGDIELKATKVFTGRDWTENDSFEFTLAADPANPEGAVLPANVKATATRDAQTVAFDKIKFTKTGTFSFTITETDGGLGGVTYDTTPKTITVEVTDNGDGTLKATPTPEIATVTAENTYAAKGEIVLKAKKVLLGERALKEGDFSFVLTYPDGKTQVKTNDAEGKVTFDKIEYTQDDIYEKDEKTGAYKLKEKTSYEYTIQEQIPEGAEKQKDGTYIYKGYTYDGTVHTIKVELTDKGDGTIDAKVAGSGDDPGDTGVVFTNAYDAAGTLKLDAEKTFKNGTLKGGEFTFELMDADGKVLQSKTNDAAGNVSFDMIAYKLADATKSPITYTVKETAGSRTDVKYDATVYTVTVELEDNSDGTLKVTKKIDNGGALKFVNEQMNVETSITISGVKVLKGKDLKAGQFKFVMMDENGKWIDSSENDADGNFTFGTITYKLSDLGGEKKKVFTYAISEVKGSDRSIIYDEKVHTVVVTVTDNGDGTMTATADKSGEDIKFVNTTRDKTGDEAPLGVLFGGLGFGAIGLAVILEDRRRRGAKKK